MESPNNHTLVCEIIIASDEMSSSLVEFILKTLQKLSKRKLTERGSRASLRLLVSLKLAVAKVNLVVSKSITYALKLRKQIPTTTNNVKLSNYLLFLLHNIPNPLFHS